LAEVRLQESEPLENACAALKEKSSKKTSLRKSSGDLFILSPAKNAV
jgi:ribosomal protein S21